MIVLHEGCADELGVNKEYVGGLDRVDTMCRVCMSALALVDRVCVGAPNQVDRVCVGAPDQVNMVCVGAPDLVDRVCGCTGPGG